MENLSYASVYNEIYKSRMEDKTKSSLLSFVRLSTKNDRHDYWVTKHLQTIYHTQKIGTHISASEYELIKKINKKAFLSIRLRLRKLQHKAIEHIWRPNGPSVSKIKKNYKS